MASFDIIPSKLDEGCASFLCAYVENLNRNYDDWMKSFVSGFKKDVVDGKYKFCTVKYCPCVSAELAVKDFVWEMAKKGYFIKYSIVLESTYIKFEVEV